MDRKKQQVKRGKRHTLVGLQISRFPPSLAPRTWGTRQGQGLVGSRETEDEMTATTVSAYE